mgnify:CR=1 FL=1
MTSDRENGMNTVFSASNFSELEIINLLIAPNISKNFLLATDSSSLSNVTRNTNTKNYFSTTLIDGNVIWYQMQQASLKVPKMQINFLQEHVQFQSEYSKT